MADRSAHTGELARKNLCPGTMGGDATQEAAGGPLTPDRAGGDSTAVSASLGPCGGQGG